MKYPLDVKPVLVEWVDSVVQGGWHRGNSEFPESDMSCVSIGNLRQKTKDYIILSLMSSPYEHGHHVTIPMSAVKRIRKLKL